VDVAAMMRRSAGFAIAAGLLAASACERRRPAGGGTLVISTAADVDYLFPPLIATSMGHQVADQIFDPLAVVGDSLNTIGDAGFRPRLARSWTWAADSLSIAFHLDPRARWHDGVPVTAGDVAFTYRLYTNPQVAAPIAPLLRNLDSVTAPDAHTAVVWFRHRGPEQFYDAASEMQILPAHVYGALDPRTLGAASAIRHPVGSGRFRFARWDAGSRIVLIADSTNYRGRPRLDRVMWTIAPDFTTAATRLLTGDADVFEAMRASTVRQAERTPEVRVVTFPGFKFAYLLFNLHDPHDPSRPHPILGDVRVRRALSMAVDRAALVRNVFDSLALVSPGPMVRAVPTSDTMVRQIPYDPAGAAHLLDSLGWVDHDGDGIRDRGGRALAFTVLVPVSSRDRERSAVLMQEEFRRIGVRMSVQSVDIPTLAHTLESHRFDAVIVQWSADPSPGGLRQIFGGGRSGTTGGANFGGYSDPRFDAELDTALSARSPGAARAVFARAYQTIVDDAPAIWLWEPEVVMGLRRRVHPAVLRPDAWWTHLADWSVAGAPGLPPR